MGLDKIQRIRGQIEWLVKQVECLKSGDCRCEDGISFSDTDLEFNNSNNTLTVTFANGDIESVIIPDDGVSSSNAYTLDIDGNNDMIFSENGTPVFTRNLDYLLDNTNLSRITSAVLVGSTLRLGRSDLTIVEVDLGNLIPSTGDTFVNNGSYSNGVLTIELNNGSEVTVNIPTSPQENNPWVNTGGSVNAVSSTADITRTGITRFEGEITASALPTLPILNSRELIVEPTNDRVSYSAPIVLSTLTLGPSVTGGTAQYRATNQTIEVILSNVDFNTAGIVITTLPVNIRPTSRLVHAAYVNSKRFTEMVYINTDGTIELADNSSTDITGLQFSIQYKIL